MLPKQLILAFRAVVLSLLGLVAYQAANADSKAIKDLTKKGGILDTADKKGKSYVDRLTDPNNTEDPADIAQERLQDFATAAAAAASAATNVPGTSLKGTRPGFFSTIWSAVKSLFGVASGTSGTTSSNKFVGFDHGVAIADAAIVSFNGLPIGLGNSFDVPYQYAAFTDSFGDARVVLYEFDFSVTSALTNITGQPLWTDGSGLVTSVQLLDLTREFGFAIEQYQLISVQDVPLGTSGTYTVHIEGWAAAPIPEPSTLLLTGAGLLLGLAAARRVSRTPPAKNAAAT